MSDDSLNAALSVVGIASIASLLLPDIDKAWSASPSDGDTRRRVRTGESIYFLILTSAGSLAALRARSWFPLLFVLALGSVVCYAYEHALNSGQG